MNVENPTIDSSIPFLCGQPSAFGLILVATAALALLAFLIAVPDLVYSQRVGATVGVLEILRMRLRFGSARPEIDVRRVLNLASRDCSLATITEVTRTATACHGQAEQLADLLLDASEQGRLSLKTITHVSDPTFYRTARNHVIGLIGAVAGTTVCAFLFYLLGGSLFLEKLMIRPDWVETVGKIEVRRHRSLDGQCEFSFRANEHIVRAACSVPRTVDLASPVRVRYDRNCPQRAVVVGGSRFHFFVFLSPLFLLPLISSVRDERVLYARQGRGAFEPYEVYPDLNTMAACMAILAGQRHLVTHLP